MREAVDLASRRLERAGVDHARREAMLLLARLLGTDRGGIVARASQILPAGVARDFGAFVARREGREPSQYLFGEEEFFGRVFAVDRRVLIPRPETEILIEAVLSLPVDGAARVLDLGTGSGCIAVTLAIERPRWSIVALDRSADALAVARANVERHEVRGRIDLVEGDLGDPARFGASFDVVVSNPPYVSEEEWRGLAPEVQDHEPKEALVPGPSGLEAYRALAPAALEVLRSGGWIALELGYRSAAGARAAVEAAGFHAVEVRPDLRGIPRVLVARKPERGSDPFSDKLALR